jgi:hypothetical protein
MGKSKNLRQEWEEFYFDYLRLKVNFSDVIIPVDSGGFKRVLFIPKGLKIVQLIKAEIITICSPHNYLLNETPDIEKLDEEITENIRTSDETYAIRLRNRPNSDWELKDLSADDLKNQSISCVTLLEQLVNNLKRHQENGELLDYRMHALCADSRRYDGNVPTVCSNPYNHTIIIGYSHANWHDEQWRGRQVISN